MTAALFGQVPGMVPGMVPGQLPGGAASPWAALQQPQGIGDYLTTNPLFLGGLSALSSASEGGDWVGSMQRGILGAQQAQQARTAQQLQGFQVNEMLRARQKAEAQEAATRKFLATPEAAGIFSELGLDASSVPLTLGQEVLAARAKAAMQPDEYAVNTKTGQLFNKRTGEVVSGMSAGSPTGLTADQIIRIANDVDATHESIQAATASGDPRDLVPKGPEHTPRSVEERTAFLKSTDQAINRYRKGAGIMRESMGALTRATAVDDILAIYGTIKALDPDSVVRGEEVRLFEQAVSTFEKLKTRAEKELGRDGILSDDLRRAVANSLRGIQETMEVSYRKTMAEQERRVGVLSMPSDILEGYPGITWPTQEQWAPLVTQPRPAAAGGGNPELDKLLRDNPMPAPGAMWGP